MADRGAQRRVRLVWPEPPCADCGEPVPFMAIDLTVFKRGVVRHGRCPGGSDARR